MPAAADFTEAYQFAVANAWVVFMDAGRTLKGQFTSWLDAVSLELPDPDDANQRTVTNWIPIAAVEVSALPAAKAGENPVFANEAGICLFRVCSAIAFAETNGRITPAQAVNLLASYNLLWS